MESKSMAVVWRCVVQEARVSTRVVRLASDHLTPMPLMWMAPTREFRQHGAMSSPVLTRLSTRNSLPRQANVGFSLEMRPHVIPTTPILPTPLDPR
jgi:hypothetical protein